MAHIRLRKLSVLYAADISSLTSHQRIKHPLGFSTDQTSIKGTEAFIRMAKKEEIQGKMYSRAIFLNENLIGITSLKDVDSQMKTSHIGTWIGYPFWGQGYNEEAKKQILHFAFYHLQLEEVFIGAKKSNIRSIQSQKKLPYVTKDVGVQYPLHLQKTEHENKEACLLNVIKKDDFVYWYEK